MLAIILIVVSVGRLVFYRRVLAGPKIEFFEGEYREEHRYHGCGLAMDYGFIENGGTRKWVSLDYKTKKDIFPDKFEKESKYKIYYEQETHIIVRVERLK